MAGFDFLNPILNPILNPLLTLVNDPNNPMFAAILGVFIIATIIAFLITLANKLLVDQDRLQYLQKEMKEYQQDMMKAQKSGDPKQLKEVQKKQSKFMEIQKEMMFNSFKPMIVTFVPIIIVFYWMATNPLLSHPVYSGHVMYVQLPIFGYYIFLVPFFQWIATIFYPIGQATPFASIGWLGWYIMVSFAMSMVFRKFLGLKGGGLG
ncbi:MAG TPA: EMC3/TMCO1 family protein [Methanobacterium sp.]|nr:EMC3/TMCO1 family protein [Methanobacterium sp.]